MSTDIGSIRLAIQQRWWIAAASTSVRMFVCVLDYVFNGLTSAEWRARLACSEPPYFGTRQPPSLTVRGLAPHRSTTRHTADKDAFYSTCTRYPPVGCRPAPRVPLLSVCVCVCVCAREGAFRNNRYPLLVVRFSVESSSDSNCCCGIIYTIFSLLFSRCSSLFLVAVTPFFWLCAVPLRIVIHENEHTHTPKHNNNIELELVWRVRQSTATISPGPEYLFHDTLVSLLHWNIYVRFSVGMVI